MARLGLYFKKEKNLTGSVLQNGSHWIKSENKKVFGLVIRLLIAVCGGLKCFSSSCLLCKKNMSQVESLPE